jgi:hypothetical protein
MQDSFESSERGGTTRVAYNSEQISEQNDPYGFNQGERSNAPNWDPYDFHQQNQPGRTNRDQTPKPGTPTELPKPPEPGIPLPKLPDAPRETRLPDGALLVSDSKGRICVTGSADGSKTREVRYAASGDEQKIDQVVIDHNRVYTRNGDSRTWSYTVNGQPGGTWYGEVHMSPNGEYSIEDDTTRQIRKFASNTTEITEQENVEARARAGNANLRQAQVNAEQQIQYDNCGRPIQSNCQPQVRYDNYNQNGQPQVRYDNYNQNGQPQVRYDNYNQNCQPQVRYDNYNQNCQPQVRYDNYNPNYEQQVRYDRYGRPVQVHYDQQMRYQNYRQPQYDCYPQNSCNGGAGANFARSMLATMAYGGMGRYGGYGFYPGGFYPRYGNGNIGGAIVGSVINRAIWGGFHRGRW